RRRPDDRPDAIPHGARHAHQLSHALLDGHRYPGVNRQMRQSGDLKKFWVPHGVVECRSKNVGYFTWRPGRNGVVATDPTDQSADTDQLPATRIGNESRDRSHPRKVAIQLERDHVIILRLEGRKVGVDPDARTIELATGNRLADLRGARVTDDD